MAGFVSRSLIDRFQCMSCNNILLADLDSYMTDDFDDFRCAEVMEFHNSIDRGGLILPSIFCLKTCKASWLTFSHVIEYQKNVFLSSDNQFEFFLSAFNQNYENIIVFAIHSECDNGQQILINIVKKFFNCCIKNMLTEFKSVRTN